MEPDHFWWLVETLSPPPKPGLSEADEQTLREMLAEAEREYQWQMSSEGSQLPLPPTSAP